MGTTYYVNQTCEFYGVYTCSKCNSVILLQFTLKLGSASTWSRNKAMEVLQEHSNVLIQALQNFHEKPFLLSSTYEGRSFTTGYEMQFENGNQPCPYCQNNESWQRGSYYADACKKDPETGVNLVADVPNESRMRVFGSFDNAKAYMVTVLAQKQEQSKLYWQDRSGEAEYFKVTVSGIKDKISNLVQSKENARNASNQIATMIIQKEEEAKQYSIFSADRKACKQNIKELQKQFEAQRDVDILRERELTAEIQKLECQVKEICIANPGVLGTTENFEGKGTTLHLAFRIS